MSKNLNDTAYQLQSLLVEIATGGDYNDEEKNKQYSHQRAEIIQSKILKKLAPEFVRNCRTLPQFWGEIRKYKSYQERREYIWASFNKLLEYLESQDSSPLSEFVSNGLEKHGTEYIKSEWQKALERSSSDPDGAITTSRSLIECVCKHILDKAGVPYKDSFDLQKLYRLTAKQLNLAPELHTDETIKQILSGCFSIVNGLSGLRNSLGDSHGKSVKIRKPHARHAHFSVNVSGSFSLFLMETFLVNQDKASRFEVGKENS